jgi:hypothetical protein
MGEKKNAGILEMLGGVGILFNEMTLEFLGSAKFTL